MRLSSRTALAVVAAAYKYAGNRMPRARARAAGALVVVARVLMEDTRQDGSAQKGADGTIGKGSAVPLGKAGGALAGPAEYGGEWRDAVDYGG